MEHKSKYTQENFIDKLSEYGYKYISGKYENAFSKLKCYDKEGYIVYVNFNKIENGSNNFRRFHNSNDCSIYNIKHYIELHPEITCSYVSGEYIDSNSIQIYKCECGNLFETSFENVRYSHKIKCNKCVTHRKVSDNITDYGFLKKIPFDIVQKNFEDMGLKILVNKEDFNIATGERISCKDKNGYKYFVSYDTLMHKGKVFSFVNRVNPYSIENINHYFQENSKGMFTCLSEEYINSKNNLKIRCNRCNSVFEQSWKNIYRNYNKKNINDNKTGARCPYCDSNQLESVHALVLKQVWQHEYPNTVTEEKSCINPFTCCPLPTDIVNHDLKVAIEIQSWFHDFPDQQKKDKIKQEYWVNRGYKFYCPDQRDFTVLEMIQLFFPYITKIPEYINFNYANKINFLTVQRLLNAGKSPKEIADILGCNSSQIYDAVHYGNVAYPNGYIRKDYTPIVQLDLKGNFIARYDKIKDAIDSTGVKYISSVLLKGRHYSGGFYWIYEQDYNSGNYTLTCRKNKNNIIESSETAGLTW